MPKSLIFLVIGWLEVFLLSACAPTGERSDYPERVASVLDRPLEMVEASLAFTPTRKALRVEVPPLSINALEFAELHRCDMGDLVGARNSGLGRLAPDSQRLGYEIQWLCRSQSCEIDWVAEMRATKAQQLSKQVWNAVFAGPEFANFLSSTEVSEI